MTQLEHLLINLLFFIDLNRIKRNWSELQKKLNKYNQFKNKTQTINHI